MTVRVTTEPNAKMEWPSYTDRRFEREPLVYLSPDAPDALIWEYSDRFIMWDADKYSIARDAAQDTDTDRSRARWHKAFLETYYPGATLHAIKATFDRGSGYPIWIYGYTTEEPTQ